MHLLNKTYQGLILLIFGLLCSIDNNTKSVLSPSSNTQRSKRTKKYLLVDILLLYFYPKSEFTKTIDILK